MKTLKRPGNQTPRQPVAQRFTPNSMKTRAKRFPVNPWSTLRKEFTTQNTTFFILGL